MSTGARILLQRAAAARSSFLWHPAFRPMCMCRPAASWQGQGQGHASDGPRPHLHQLLVLPHSLYLNLNPSSVRHFSVGKTSLSDGDGEKKKKPGVVARFKQMFKDYWYVLVPVHMATSIVWFGGFYVMCKTGVDVVAILKMCGMSEQYLDKIQNSDVQYYALAYACYKVATPAR